ncbi:MAG: DUF1667 domain-containing protein [Bacillota bacterium]
MKTRELTCIQCPLSCRITASGEGDQLKFTGNQCKQGIEYARQEVTNPTRTLTTTVATVFPDFPVLPARTTGEVPMGKIFEIMNAIRVLKVEKRLKPGDVILENIANTDTALIATADMCETVKSEAAVL